MTGKRFSIDIPAQRVGKSWAQRLARESALQAGQTGLVASTQGVTAWRRVKRGPRTFVVVTNCGRIVGKGTG
jgi:hypothetical protein